MNNSDRVQLVNGCPECGSVNFRVQKLQPGETYSVRPTYKCCSCGAEFNAPVTRRVVK